MTAVISNLLRDRTEPTQRRHFDSFASKMDAFNPEQSKTLTDGSVVTLSDEQIAKFKDASRSMSDSQLYRATKLFRNSSSWH